MLNKVLNLNKVREFKTMLENSSRIVITCHVRPDGDAIGSILGLLNLLEGMDRETGDNRHRSIVAVTPDQAPRSLWFLPGMKNVVAYTRYADYVKRLFSEADLIVCCDFNQPSRQDQLEPLLTASTARKVLVDHHEGPWDFTDLSFSFPRMSSTCELMFRIIAAMGYYEYMNLDSATCLCTGLITDTRNFSVNCDNPEIYQILMLLLEKGVNKQRIVKEALETKSFDSVKLQAYAISEKLELLQKGRGALVCLGQEELNRFNYERGDTEGLVNVPLEIKEVIYSFFLREDEDGVKISARSVNNFPVNRICQELFGGGGHVMAAGAEYHGTLEDCKKILVEHLPQYEEYLKNKNDK